ncbi:Crp/Fnr family transcriptional regulator [Chitinophaga jiangningensis]|nr:Crp/Fnr family transcriptional regulator [Chitinophaga jiangningensis]
MSLAGLFPIDKWNFKTQSILNELPEGELAELNAHMQEIRFGKGEVIFREGAVATGIYFLKKGKVKKYQVGQTGREHIIYIANAGEFIGYHAILAEERYPDSAAALEECLAGFIAKEEFLRILQQSTTLPRRLLKVLSHEFTVLSNSISVFAQRSVKERLAIALIVLREKFKIGTTQPDEIIINLSRSDLAGMVGTGSENIVRILAEFKSAGIITSQGRKICIKDIRRLITISQSGNL